MSEKDKKRLIEIIASLPLFFANIGLVWLFAWMWNPDINSNTVWFIANLWALLTTDIFKAKEEIKEVIYKSDLFL